MSTFHIFPRLPVELRLAIWRECLPHRTCELDIPLDSIVFNLQTNAPSCKLWDTTYMNGRPPIISRVCRESRAVAFETGRFRVFSEDMPQDAWWSSGNTVSLDAWEDYTRDSVHLNWNSAYSADYISNGSPLHCLAWSATQMRHGGSLMISFLADSVYHDISISQRIDALVRLPRWVVVIRVVVVHTDFRTSAATGLFGLLGDACIQVVDVSDKPRVNAFFDLGNRSECHVVDVSDEETVITPFDLLNVSERQSHVTDGQDLHRDSVESIKQRLRDVIVKTFGSEESVPPMHPAIMFRLCTRMCNHPSNIEDSLSPTSIQMRGGRGRGSGRGRNLARGRGRGG